MRTRSLITSCLSASTCLIAAQAWAAETGDFVFSLYDTTKSNEIRSLNASDEVPATGAYAVYAKPQQQVSKVIFRSSCMADALEVTESPYLLPLPAKEGTCAITVVGMTDYPTENRKPANLTIKITEGVAPAPMPSSSSSATPSATTGVASAAKDAAPSAADTQADTTTPTATAPTATSANSTVNVATAATTGTSSTTKATTPVTTTDATPAKPAKYGLIKDENGNIMYRVAPTKTASAKSRVDTLTASGAALSPDVFLSEIDTQCAFPANCANEYIKPFRASEGIGRVAVTEGNATPPVISYDKSSFTFTCGVSHFAYFDPIRAPNKGDNSNLNMFFGNTRPDVDFSLPNAPEKRSTCAGGTLNMSSYWVPALLNADGAVQLPSKVQVEYASSILGASYKEVAPMPKGIAMMTGMPTATVPLGMSEVSFACGDKRGNNIPVCAPNTTLTMQVQFRQCWDGETLTSDDQSHVATYSNGQCPKTHPVMIPALTYFIDFPVKTDSLKWRLASDRYDMKTKNNGGFSLFGGYIDAWDKATAQTWFSNCLAAGKRCIQTLGNGTGLK